MLSLVTLLEAAKLTSFARSLQDFGVEQVQDLKELHWADLEELGMTRVQLRRLHRVAFEVQRQIKQRQQIHRLAVNKSQSQNKAIFPIR